MPTPNEINPFRINIPSKAHISQADSTNRLRMFGDALINNTSALKKRRRKNGNKK